MIGRSCREGEAGQIGERCSSSRRSSSPSTGRCGSGHVGPRSEREVVVADRERARELVVERDVALVVPPQRALAAEQRRVAVGRSARRSPGWPGRSRRSCRRRTRCGCRPTRGSCRAQQCAARAGTGGACRRRADGVGVRRVVGRRLDVVRGRRTCRGGRSSESNERFSCMRTTMFSIGMSSSSGTPGPSVSAGSAPRPKVHAARPARPCRRRARHARAQSPRRRRPASTPASPVGANPGDRLQAQARARPIAVVDSTPGECAPPSTEHIRSGSRRHRPRAGLPARTRRAISGAPMATPAAAEPDRPPPRHARVLRRVLAPLRGRAPPQPARRLPRAHRRPRGRAGGALRRRAATCSSAASAPGCCSSASPASRRARARASTSRPACSSARAPRGLDVREASVTAIPFADASFDVTCSFKVLAHVPEIGRALAEMARVTRPGRRGHRRVLQPAQPARPGQAPRAGGAISEATRERRTCTRGSTRPGSSPASCRPASHRGGAGRAHRDAERARDAGPRGARRGAAHRARLADTRAAVFGGFYVVVLRKSAG